MVTKRCNFKFVMMCRQSYFLNFVVVILLCVVRSSIQDGSDDGSLRSYAPDHGDYYTNIQEWRAVTTVPEPSSIDDRQGKWSTAGDASGRGGDGEVKRTRRRKNRRRRKKQPQQSKPFLPDLEDGDGGTTPDYKSYRKPYSSTRNQGREQDEDEGIEDIKSLLKQSGGLSLSEVLQQSNLSLTDLLTGKQRAISALKMTDQIKFIDEDTEMEIIDIDENGEQTRTKIPSQNKATKHHFTKKTFITPDKEYAISTIQVSETDLSDEPDEDDVKIEKEKPKRPVRLPPINKMQQVGRKTDSGNIPSDDHVDEIPQRRRLPNTSAPKRNKYRNSNRIYETRNRENTEMPFYQEIVTQRNNIRVVEEKDQMTDYESDTTTVPSDMVENVNKPQEQDNTFEELKENKEEMEQIDTEKNTDHTENRDQIHNDEKNQQMEEVMENDEEDSMKSMKDEDDKEMNEEFTTVDTTTMTTTTSTTTTTTPTTTTTSKPQGRLGLKPKLRIPPIKNPPQRISVTRFSTPSPIRKNVDEDIIIPAKAIPIDFEDLIGIEKNKVKAENASSNEIITTTTTTEEPSSTTSTVRSIVLKRKTTQKPRMPLSERKKLKEPSAKDEILEVLNDSKGGEKLARILADRNMSLGELVDQRERGSSQLHLADIFHNSSKEPNVGEPFLSKSMIEPISKQIYPLKALLEANLRQTNTKSQQINTSITSKDHQTQQQGDDAVGIMTLFEKFAQIGVHPKDIKPSDIKKDSEGSSYFTSVISVKPTNEIYRESRNNVGFQSSNKQVSEIFSSLPTYINSEEVVNAKVVPDWNTPSLGQVSGETLDTKGNEIEHDLDGDGLIVLGDLIQPGDAYNLEQSGASKAKYEKEEKYQGESNTTGGIRAAILVSGSIIGTSIVVFLTILVGCRVRQMKRRKRVLQDHRGGIETVGGRKLSLHTSRSASPILPHPFSSPISSHHYQWDSLKKPFQ